MAINNLNGHYRTTRSNMMAAYDKLPPELRQALANAVENWVAQIPLTQYRYRKYDSRPVLLMIKRWDRTELTKREKQRRTATGPYTGNAPDPK